MQAHVFNCPNTVLSLAGPAAGSNTTGEAAAAVAAAAAAARFAASQSPGSNGTSPSTAAGKYHTATKLPA